MKIWKAILSIVLLVIVAQVIHTVGAMSTMNYYTNPNYFPVWSKLMMPYAGPPPASFQYLSLTFGLITWTLFVCAYWMVKTGIPGSNNITKGLLFGLIAFMVSGLSGTLPMILLINLPIKLIAYWGIENLVILSINGMITSELN
jgi:hypothetical protein